MRKRLFDQPLLILLIGIAGLSMYLPAIHATVQRSHSEARAFFYAGMLTLTIVTLVAIAMAAQPRRRSSLRNLAALMAAFTLLPLILAVPFHDALGTTSFLNSYVEMVSSLTTTGATLFDPARLSPTLHLWRGMVGWMGGFLIWVAASAILAPLNLGGFEVTATSEPGQGETRFTQGGLADPQQRIIRVTAQLLPIYTGLTLALWLMLLILGDPPLVALIHGMSVMATSGISPLGGVQDAASGLAGEMLIALFLLFGLSRLTFSSDTITTARRGIQHDPEFRLGMLLALGVTVLLFLRHYLGAFQVSATSDMLAPLRALWGSFFTILSFLTTTGFQSAYWEAARSWSGLETSGIILMGLALMGGGVATTAGGVKLLRVWALYLHGLREMDRLVHPSSVGHSRSGSSRIARKGAFFAWIFFMFFAVSLMFLSLAFAALGSTFEQAIVLSIAGLTTTGPLVGTGSVAPVLLIELGQSAKLLFCAAMVLGRLELLAFIALLTSSFWRD
ncbi:potassium transporter TrkG [Seohaeicola sp. SP36]|uniref:TrkH family potassium uptake protein n=1 Tax=unclassified Seohaeicola TaxID=2641111 RepID=UPI00237BB1E5|nr:MULTISPECIES: potassium transporter TrkG [unclassified Seohaeicola]MDD9707302.1 potassium transporter TrkG [Seohaeicola sp. 4SK31]MDD9735543.1 potassium transporter TrkG [Seohaeicola sp. SP36]